jgi:phosphoribosyl 1,2-cyclic phosphodiesterase
VAVLGSGSRGNAVALSVGNDTVFVDAGFGIRSLQRRARAAGIDLASTRGILLTHEHGDHARGAQPLATRTGAPVYASAGTLAALGPKLDGVRTVPLAARTGAVLGPFAVSCVATTHDAAEPLALLVRAGEDGPSVGLAYDLGRVTHGVRHLLRQASCVILEANHDDLLLRTGPYPAAVRARIAGPGGHLSNRDTAEVLADVCHAGLETVVLAHLSDRCNTAELAAEVAGAALERCGYRGRMLVAAQGAPLAPFLLGSEQQVLDGLS